MTNEAKTGAELIAEERKRQIEEEGHAADRDDDLTDASLVQAAICYAVNKIEAAGYGDTDWPEGTVPVLAAEYDFFAPGQACDFEEPVWPWVAATDNREKHDRKRSLVVAGALIAAEIDRLTRLEGGAK